MIEPLEKEIDGRTFILSKFPAFVGREIITQYPLSALPKIGDYKVNEQLLLKLMAYVALKVNDEQHILLVNRTLIDNHVPSWEMLAKIEMAMIEYNCSFFRDGRASTFLENILQKGLALITKTLTGSLAQSSPTEQPPSTN